MTTAVSYRQPLPDSHFVATQRRFLWEAVDGVRNRPSVSVLWTEAIEAYREAAQTRDRAYLLASQAAGNRQDVKALTASDEAMNRTAERAWDCIDELERVLASAAPAFVSRFTLPELPGDPFGDSLFAILARQGGETNRAMLQMSPIRLFRWFPASRLVKMRDGSWRVLTEEGMHLPLEEATLEEHRQFSEYLQSLHPCKDKGGRRHGSGYFADTLHFDAEVMPIVRKLRQQNPRREPTQGEILREMGVARDDDDTSQFRQWLRRFHPGKSYQEYLALVL